MTDKDELYIVPKRDSKTKQFIGYEVRNAFGPVKGKDGKPVVLKEQKNFYAFDKNEDSHPTKNAPDGIYALATHDSDNYTFYYQVKYGKRNWKISESEHTRNKEPELFFVPKSEKGSFLGYGIRQYDEAEGKVVSRGTVAPENVSYERRKDGRVNCIYKDRRVDGMIKEYHIETVSLAEFEKRPNARFEENGSVLSRFAADITNEPDKISTYSIEKSQLR